MSQTFAIARVNGKSNSDVLIDLVKRGNPDDLFTYEELSAALSEGTREFSKAEVQGAVNRARHKMLTSLARTLRNVRNSGYRIAQASEHGDIAKVHADKAHNQLRTGLSILKNVRWDELDPQVRQVHEGTLLLVQGLYGNQQALERRLRRVEEAIANVRGNEAG